MKLDIELKLKLYYTVRKQPFIDLLILTVKYFDLVSAWSKLKKTNFIVKKFGLVFEIPGRSVNNHRGSRLPSKF